MCRDIQQLCYACRGRAESTQQKGRLEMTELEVVTTVVLRISTRV